MAPSTTMTILVEPDVKEKLDRLAAATRRSTSLLAGEAVSAYVDREIEIIAGIKRGLDDIHGERLVPHADAIAEIQAIVEAAKSGRG
jgi:predicted transcriptional regulator